MQKILPFYGICKERARANFAPNALVDQWLARGHGRIGNQIPNQGDSDSMLGLAAHRNTIRQAGQELSRHRLARPTLQVVDLIESGA